MFLGRNLDTGKRQYYSETYHGGKKDADRRMNRLLTQRSDGTLQTRRAAKEERVEPSGTLNAHLDTWLKTTATGKLKQHSLAHYELILRLYVRPGLGELNLVAITAERIQTLYADMLERGLSSATIRLTHAVLSKAFRQAIRWDRIKENPLMKVELPTLKNKEMRPLTPEEIPVFVAAAREDRFYYLFLFELGTGLRPEELLGLQWSDVQWPASDCPNGNISIQRSLIREKKGKWRFDSPKTEKSRRRIPIPSGLINALREHRRIQNEERLKAGAGYQQNNLVFANRDGSPVNAGGQLRQHFKAILVKAGLPPTIRLYDLRHTHATMLLAENQNPKVVSERLGHTSVVITLDRYSHVLPTMQQGASDAVERVLFARVGNI